MVRSWHDHDQRRTMSKTTQKCDVHATKYTSPSLCPLHFSDYIKAPRFWPIGLLVSTFASNLLIWRQLANEKHTDLFDL